MTADIRREIVERCRTLVVSSDRIKAEVSRLASDPDVETIKAAIREIVRVTPQIAARL